MDWGFISSLALVAAGAGVVGHSLVRLVTGRVSARGAADSWLIGLGAAVVGIAPHVAGVPEPALNAGGLVLVLCGTLLWLRDRARRPDQR